MILFSFSSFATVITKEELSKRLLNWVDFSNEDELKVVAKEKSKAVVLIYAIGSRNPKDKRIFNAATAPSGERVDFVTSGTLVSADGVIVTKSRSIAKGVRILIHLGKKNNVKEITKNTFEAVVLKNIPELGVLFLKITSKTGKKLPFITLGNDATLTDEQHHNVMINAIAVGKARGERFVNPWSPANISGNFSAIATNVGEIVFSKENGIPTFTMGSVVGMAATPETDGGPLLNRKGELVGIVDLSYDSFLLPRSEAIPVSVVKKGLQFLSVASFGGSDKSSGVGVKIGYVENAGISEQLKSVGFKSNSGQKFVEIVAVELGSSAEQAGCLPKDIVLKFGNDAVTTTEVFRNLENASIGDQSVVFTVLRDKNLVELEIRK
jgi:S1-C subfamily serine protease